MRCRGFFLKHFYELLACIVLAVLLRVFAKSYLTFTTIQVKKLKIICLPEPLTSKCGNNRVEIQACLFQNL